MLDLVNHWKQEMQDMLMKEKAREVEEEEEEVPHAEVIQPIDLIEETQPEENLDHEKLPRKDETASCKEEIGVHRPAKRK